MARLLRRVARIESFSGSTSRPSLYLSIASCILFPLKNSLPASLSESRSLTFRRRVLRVRGQHLVKEKENGGTNRARVKSGSLRRASWACAIAWG